MSFDTNSSWTSTHALYLLAAWYSLMVCMMVQPPTQCVRSDITLGVDLISDTGPDNDTMAWYALMDPLIAIDDEVSAVAAVSMLRFSMCEDREPSGKPSDVHGSDGDSTLTSDGDTRAGASDEGSLEAQIDSTLPSLESCHTDQPRTI